VALAPVGALVGALALAGRSLGGTSAAPGPPPDAAAVLQRVKSLTPTDASCKIHVEGTSGGKTLSGGVTGQLVTKPKRADLIYNLTLDGQQLSFESIEDDATKTTYTYFTIPAQLHTGLWVKQTTQSGALIDATGLVDWSDVSDLTMVGPDKLGDLNVCHLRGTDTSGGTPTQGDTPSRHIVGEWLSAPVAARG
jgi:hypothetical protein